MATSTVNTNKPIIPRGADVRPIDSYNRAALYSGKALDFDGVNDEVNCGDINIAFNEISFAFHFNADSLSNNCIFQKESVFRFIGVNTNQIDIVLATTGNSWYSKKMTLTNLESKDYFLVATYNGSELKAYLNGVLVDTLSGYAGDVANTSQNVYVGRSDGGLYYNGKVSGTKIFNTALTAAQIADLYNNPEKIVPTGVDNTALKLWLPMMEGAGTTAYDGSGNGNHGTIAGATYVNGVGAPVAQTSVIDWNKGTNYVDYSNDFTKSSWTTPRAILTSGQSGILGSNTAWKIESNETGYTGGYDNTTSLNVVNCSSIYAKAGNIDYLFVTSTTASTGNAQYFNLSTGTLGSLVGSGITSADIEDVGDGWYRCSVVMSANASVGYMVFGIASTDGVPLTDSGKYIYVQNAQLNNGSSVQPYTPTIGTTQPTPVLLPAGLTTGRDITGVNLFENVRKQGALNLDGNSWAEVHDNESLDFGTGSFSIEAWVKADFLSQGSGVNTILSLGGDITSSDNSALVSTSSAFSFWIGGVNKFTPAYVSESWNHIVGVRSGSSVIFYFNGAQVATGSSSSSITNEQVKQIGRDTTTIRNYPNQLAQPRIYNRALTASEVLNNYNVTKDLYI